jgi:hypothetical protein
MFLFSDMLHRAEGVARSEQQALSELVREGPRAHELKEELRGSEATRNSGSST